MIPVNVQLLKTQCDAYFKKGLNPDAIITIILGNETYKNLSPTDRDSLAIQMQSYLQTLSTARPVDAKVVPVFPISTVRYTSTGEQKHILEKGHPENLKFLITQIMQMSPEYNLLKRRVYINGVMFNDDDIGNIRNRCREYGLSDAKDFAIEVLTELAKNNKYHPFLRALESVTWDGHDYITDLFNTLTPTNSSIQHKDWYLEYLKRWLVGVCAKVLNPGDQNLVLTFKSKQGDGKSRWLQKLASIAPEIYGEEEVDTANKDHILRHINYIIWHIPEIDGSMRKSDAAALKSYLTMADIAVREAYNRTDTVAKSCLSFVASVNGDEFLVDDTGSRRYLVMDLAQVNPDHNVNVLQVWAQAMHLYRSGTRHWFDKSEIEKINELNEEFQTKNYVDHIASKVEPGTDYLTSVEIFAFFFGKTSPHTSELNKLSRLLSKKGITKERRIINGSKITVFAVKKPEKPIF